MTLFWKAPLDLVDVLTWAELLRSSFDDGYVVWTMADEDFLQALIDTVYGGSDESNA